MGKTNINDIVTVKQIQIHCDKAKICKEKMLMRILQAGGNFMFDHQISRFRIKAFLCLLFEGKNNNSEFFIELK